MTTNEFRELARACMQLKAAIDNIKEGCEEFDVSLRDGKILIDLNINSDWEHGSFKVGSDIENGEIAYYGSQIWVRDGIF